MFLFYILKNKNKKKKLLLNPFYSHNEPIKSNNFDSALKSCFNHIMVAMKLWWLAFWYCSSLFYSTLLHFWLFFLKISKINAKLDSSLVCFSFKKRRECVFLCSCSFDFEMCATCFPNVFLSKHYCVPSRTYSMAYIS